MQKLYRNHLWISLPNEKNISYLGLSNWSKNYFLRFKDIDHSSYFKTIYGINLRNRINTFLTATRNQQHKLHKLNTQTAFDIANNPDNQSPISSHQIQIQYEQLCKADQIEYDRFAIRRDQPFSLLRCVEFDVQLQAPASMRVLQLNFQIQYYEKIYEEEWIYKVQLLEDINASEGFLTEEQYQNSNKFISYTGLTL